MRCVLVTLPLLFAITAAQAHAERALVKLEPPALTDDEARTRIDDGARFVRRSVLGWVVIDVTSVRVMERVPLKRAFMHAASNDPLLVDGTQWAIDMIRAEDAWAISTGTGQRIGVVDTGLVRDHPDIAAVDGGGYDFVNDENADAPDATLGRDDDYSDTAPDGPLSHGSHVAGIIAALSDNGVGMAGINWDATLISARAVAGTAGGTNIDIMEAALWLAGGDVAGAPAIGAPVDVINMSVGFENGCDAFAQDIVDDIVARGIPIVAAVGNHGDVFGRLDQTVLSPADCTGVVAVGAADANGALTDYTNDEGVIDVVAPGGTLTKAILSLGSQGDYVGQMGTSMATPHVTGVVSLMRSVDPSLTPLEIEAMLRALPATCAGCGDAPLLDAAAALEAAQAGEAEAAGGCAASPMPPFCCVLVALLLVRRRR